MGKALILDADFSAVALDTVTFDSDPIPCTGITLSKSTATFTEVGDTDTVTATLTPSDTTDTVTWTSSNENVATVSGGVITIHGIGTATITATCGQQTATVSINQTSLQFTDIDTVEGYRANSNSNALAIGSNSGDVAIGKTSTNVDNLRVYKSSSSDSPIEAIPVPYGATSVTIIATSRTYWSYLYIGNATEQVTVLNKQYAKYTKNYSSFYSDVAKDVEYGQCVILSSSAEKVANVTGLLFQ